MPILRVREPFSVDQGGCHRTLRAGDLVDESDPVVTSGRRQFFEPVEVAATREQTRVESASAAPGERRSVKPAVHRKPKTTEPKTEDDGAGPDAG